MIELKPISVNGFVSNKNKIISPDKHYVAYTAKNGRELYIINIKDKDNLCISTKDFKHDFFSPFSKSITIRQISFNNDSNSLYCLMKKSQYTKLYHFKNKQNSHLPISKQWYKSKKIYLPFNATSFTINEATQELNLVGFTEKQVIYQVLKLQTQELITKNVAPVDSNITKVKLDPDNMKLSVLSENKNLKIFTKINNDWQVKNTLYDCNDIPVSSQDGNILVDKKVNKLEIRSLLEPHYGKVVYTAKCKFPIIDFSINAAGNKIKVFSKQYKYYSDITCSTFYTDGNPLLWVETDYTNSITLSLCGCAISYADKICPLFTSDDKLIILLDIVSKYYYDYKRAIGKSLKIKEPRIRQNNALSFQNSNNQPSNSFFTRNAIFIDSIVASANQEYYCDSEDRIYIY